MAYCKECGAYIPDGQNKCLACGYDAAAEAERAARAEKRNGAAAGGYAYQQEAEEQERRRRERQERSRQWAEEEYARRQAERQRAEEQYARRQEAQERAEEDFSRRQEAQERRSESFVNRAGRPRSSSASINKGLAALSYLSILFILPFILCPEDRFARFHAKQGFALFVFGAIADVISAIVPIGWVLTLFRIWCIFKGMSNAGAGREEPLPYIGKYALK